MSGITEERWEAKDAYVFLGNDCIAICDTDNGTKEQYRARAQMMATAPEIADALKDLIEIINKAGVLNLMRGVELGAMSWAVKCNGCLEYANTVLSKATTPNP